MLCVGTASRLVRSYTRTAALFRDLTIARADGSERLLAKLSRIDLLVIDDYAMVLLSESVGTSGTSAKTFIKRDPWF
jgi:DNA replication protein DnaC